MNLFPEFKGFNKIPRYSRECTLTEKLDGCFHYESKIFTDKGYICIGKIVNNQLPYKVLSYNFKKKQFEFVKILSYYKKESTYKDFLNFKLQGFKQGSAYYSFHCTPNHLLYTSEGYKRADKITLRDKLMSPNGNLTYIQKQMILGTMLGDASLNSYTGNSILYHHSQKEKHKNYSNLIKYLLDRFYNSERITLGGYASTPIKHVNSNGDYKLQEYLCQFKKDKKKYFSNEILQELSPISLAFWYMDDGSSTFNSGQRGRVTLHTQGFEEKQINILLKTLQRNFNLKFKKYNYGKGWQITLNSEDSEKFYILVSPYIVKDLQYKLPAHLRTSHCYWDTYKNLDKEFHEQKIIEIKKNKTMKSMFHYKYDIETKNHNYVVSGILVHNSNGILYIDFDMNIFAGSRTRWLWGSVQNEIHNDNHGFAQWVKEHKEELLSLGTGFHYGEWMGKGINRNYGLKENRFYLFNVKRWMNNLYKPECCYVVPVLFEGMFTTENIEKTLEYLKETGSVAVPGWMKPEGIVIFHKHSGHLYKKTVEGDEKPKGKNE